MDANEASLQRIRVRGVSDMTGIDAARDGALRTAVEAQLRASSSFSEAAIADATSMLLDLGLPVQYFEGHSSAAIANHVATLLGA